MQKTTTTRTSEKWPLSLAKNSISWCALNIHHSISLVRYKKPFSYQLTEAVIKQPPFCRQHIQIHFCWIKIVVLWFKFDWNLFPGMQSIHHWFRYWLGAVKVTSHYLKQSWPSLLMHICVTRSWCVNTSRLSDTYICCRKPGHHCFTSWSFAYPVLNHYLNKYWCVVNLDPCQWNLNQYAMTFS